ncbi:unnamed protein product [Schistosoma intercalatum]|nr:unnamed protein product [Schistosoma intercalatum]
MSNLHVYDTFKKFNHHQSYVYLYLLLKSFCYLLRFGCQLFINLDKIHKSKIIFKQTKRKDEFNFNS